MDPFLRPRPVDRPELRLVVFHHAGGSASAYYRLVQALPAHWDLLLLDLPGRGRRHRSAPVPEMARLVALATADVRDRADVPLYLFGHSMGALLAAEVGRRLQAEGVPPQWVGVSGRPAPGCAAGADRVRPDLSDAELMRQLIAMGGIPDRIDEAPDFRDRMLRLIRQDLRAVESYRPAPDREPLAAPLTAFGGTDDPWAPPRSMAGWEAETAVGFRHRLFSGGHFHFLGDAFARFARVLREEIDRCPVRSASS